MDVILNTFDEKSLFGFYNYTMEYKERIYLKENVHMDYRDNCSFLEGSAGIVLCLMNYLYPERNSWMRHLLID